MLPIARETMYAVYLGEPVMIVAMDNLNEIGSEKAMVEIEYYQPAGALPIGTRKVVPFHDITYGLPRPRI